MKLSTVIKQDDAKGFLNSGLKITVEYNPTVQIVEGVISVNTTNYQKLLQTDITVIMWGTFHDALEMMVNSIDWRQIYADHVISAAFHNHGS